jgi:pentatricopeptide repeat protein
MQLKAGETSKCFEALEVLSKKDISDKEYMKYKSTLSLLLWKTDKKIEALNVMEEVVSSYKNTIVYGTIGYFKLEMLPVEEALEFNEEAYNFSSSDPVIADNYAACLIKNGEPEKAIEIYEKIISKEILIPEIYFNYGMALLKIREVDKAESAFSQALECNFSFTSTIQKEEIVDALKNLKE